MIRNTANRSTVGSERLRTRCLFGGFVLSADAADPCGPDRSVPIRPSRCAAAPGDGVAAP